LIWDPAQKERIVKTYTEIVSAKPVEKPQRLFPPKNAAQQKQPPPPPEPEKKP
jgi:hypothetical protein